MHYTLNQLRILHKIAETESVTKAAEELHLTQPAVSIQLKKLQDQFEIPLTEVIGRQLYITEFGREIVNSSARILEEVNNISNKTLAYRGQLVGELRISVVSTGKYVMPYFLSDFMENNKGIDLRMDVTNKSRVVESLQNNEVDFALVSVIPEHLHLLREELMPNILYLVGSSKRIERKKISAKKIFSEEPLIFREPGSATRKAMEQYLNQHNYKANKKMTLTSNEATKQAVLAGLGYSIMPLIGIKNELDSKKLKIVPAKGLPITTNWNLVWLKEKKFSPVATAYLNFLREQKASIIQKQFSWAIDPV